MGLYHLSNYRTEEQLADMLRLEADGICIFCPQHLDNDPQQRVVHRSRHWTVTPNEFPYRGTRHHLLLVPHQHVTDLVDLPEDAQADFWTALRWVRDSYRLSFYSLASRCGDCRFTGATVAHIHVHVIVGDVDDPEHESIRIKLSQRAQPEREEQLRRRL